MSDFWWQVAEQEQQEMELSEEQELELIEYHKWLDQVNDLRDE
jgi:hypothetical protein